MRAAVDVTYRTTTTTACECVVRATSGSGHGLVTTRCCRKAPLLGGGKWFLFVFALVCGTVSAAAVVPPTISSFPQEKLRVYLGTSNSQLSYFRSMYFDPTNPSVLYVGGADFLYRLNATDVRSSPALTQNLTATPNFASIYSSSFSQCIQQVNGGQIFGNPAVLCQNIVRTIYVIYNSNYIYICSTGAFNPQEFILDYNSLNVVSVNAQASGVTKCPSDPSAIYSYVYSVSGNPYNVATLYTAVANDRNTDFVALFRPTLYQSPISTSPALGNLLRTEPADLWINADGGAVTVVATFDIGPYVFYFLREVALEITTATPQAYYSRVGRVCKSDQGGVGLKMEFRFTTFLKARLVCSVQTASSRPVTQLVFNEIYDVYYNSSTKLFYALFMTSRNGQWGSAVCQYSLDNINSVFDTGSWAELYAADTQSWIKVPSSAVPSPRPGQCFNDTRTYSADKLTFISKHLLMWDVVYPTTGMQPLYFSKLMAFDKLSVDFTNNCTVLYLYSQALVQLHRVVTWLDPSSLLPSFNTVSVWQPFSTIPLLQSVSPVAVWNMAFQTVQQNKWLFMTTDAAVVQLNPEQCSSYAYCTDCARDPYCGWDSINGVCSPFQSGLMQAASSNATVVLGLCTQSCSAGGCVPRCAGSYARSGTVPGMSLSMNCSTQCTADVSTASWYFLANGSTAAAANPVPVDVDHNYILTRDNGLVILFVNASQHVGTFQCRSPSGAVLSQHTVTLSVCEYGESVRDVMVNEFVKYCAEFDKWAADIASWRTYKDSCAASNCSTGSG